MHEASHAGGTTRRGSLVAPAATLGAGRTMTRPAVRLGLIGAGKHGTRYLTHAQRDVPGLTLAALCRQDAQAGAAQAAQVGARFFASLEELIAAREVDAVAAVVPPVLHPRVVQACIGARKPLLLEKPLAIDAATACHLRDALAAAGLPCLLAHTLRWSAVVRRVRELLPGLGRLHQIVLGQSFEPSRLDWLDDPARSGGGNVLHTGVHGFDLVRHLSGGEVGAVFCRTERILTRGTEDLFSALLEVEIGADAPLHAVVSAARTTRSRYGEIRLIGEGGQIAADHVLGRVERLEDRRVVQVESLADAPTVAAVLSDFVALVVDGRPSPVTAADGAAAVAIAEACYRSARTGARVEMTS